MRGWEHEGSGWPSWAWHTEGESKERDVLIEGASLGLGKKNGCQGTSWESTRMTPRFLSVLDWVPELVFSCDQIGDYPNCQQRAFIL